MGRGFDIRPATEEDYPQIKRIANQHRQFLPFVMRVSIVEATKGGEVYVAHVGDHVVGFVNFHKRRDGTTTIHEIAVDRASGGTGVGKSLVGLLDRPIMLKVTQDNPANQFYQKLGFEIVGTQHGKIRPLNVYRIGPEKNDGSV